MFHFPNILDSLAEYVLVPQRAFFIYELECLLVFLEQLDQLTRCGFPFRCNDRGFPFGLR